MAAVDERRRARAAGRGRRGREPAADARALPGAARERVREALESVRPYMESHGGSVELLSLADGVAAIRLEGHCRGCAASASTLELGIRQALEASAPDLQGLEVDRRARGADARAAAGAILLPMAGGAAPAARPRRLRAATHATSRPASCARSADLRRAQAPDPPRRAPDRLRRARPAGRCAPATPSSARSATAASGWRTCGSPTSSGRRSGSRSGSRSS